MANLELSNVILQIIETYLKENVCTSIPGVIIGVDSYASQQVVDVQPLVNDLYKDGKAVELAPMLDVPVQMPAGGGGVVTFPVQKGDTVLLVFSQRSIDEFLESKNTRTVTPRDPRTFNAADAIAIPGVYSKNTNLKPNPTDVEIKFKDGSISIKPDNTILMTNGSGTVELKPSGEIEMTFGSGSLTMQTSGEVLHNSGAVITAGGDFVTAAGTSLDTHTHEYVLPDTPAPAPQQPGTTTPPA